MKKNELITRCKNVVENTIVKATSLYKKHESTILKMGVAALLFMMVSDMSTVVAFAAEAGEDKDIWSTFVDNFLGVWLKRAGGAVAIVGGVEYGYGFFADDGNAKTKGIRIVIGGAIIWAVGAGVKQFL